MSGSQLVLIIVPCPDCAFLLCCRPCLCKSSRKTLKAPLQQIPITTRRLLMVPVSPTSHSVHRPTVLGKCTPPASWAAPLLCKEAHSVSCPQQMLTLWWQHRPISAFTPSFWTWVECVLLTSWAQKHWARLVLYYKHSQATHQPGTFYSLGQLRQRCLPSSREGLCGFLLHLPQDTCKALGKRLYV